MPNPNHRAKVTIEDLIRLKRAERPAVEFWAGFDRELRQKQLVALLEKRSWWKGLPQAFARHAYLPVGATAILAFTLVSVKLYVPAQVSQADRTLVPGRLPMVDSTVAVVPASNPAGTLASSPLINRHKESEPSVDVPMQVSVASSSVSVATVAATPATPVALELDSPSARSFAANLARLEQSEPELVNSVLGNRLSPPARVQLASAPVGDLASVPVSSSRRSRILAQYVDRQLSPEPTAPEIVRERLARRLGDSDLGDRISRIGIRGDEVSLGLTLRL
jgi:hypothetical protein